MNDIAARIKSARIELGLSQVELAQLANVSPGTIGNLEAGTRQAPRNLLAIAAALKVTPEWLESGKGPRSSTPDEPAAIMAGLMRQLQPKQVQALLAMAESMLPPPAIGTVQLSQHVTTAPPMAGQGTPAAAGREQPRTSRAAETSAPASPAQRAHQADATPTPEGR